MRWPRRKAVRLLSLVVMMLAIAWLVLEPGIEPVVTAVAALIGLIGSSSEGGSRSGEDPRPVTETDHSDIPAPDLEPGEVRSLVVLPFDNLSPDPEDAFFADGSPLDKVSMLLSQPSNLSSRLLVLSLWILASCASRPEQLERSDLIVFEGATLIDGTGSPPKELAVLVIAGDRIHRVGTMGDFSYPSNAVVRDLSGHWIIPGLIETHAHLPSTPARQQQVLTDYLGYGVTTLVVMAAGPASGLDVRSALAAGTLQGPRVLTAGQAINGPSWLDEAPSFARVESEADVREAVRRQVVAGVDLVKVYAHLGPDLVCAAIDEAHAAGIPVAGHLGHTTWEQAATCGIDIIVHSALAGPIAELDGRVPPKQSPELVFPPAAGLGTYDPQLYAESMQRVDLDGAPFKNLLRTLADRSVVIDPNLVVMESIIWSDDPLLRRRPAFAPEPGESAVNTGHIGTAAWTAQNFAAVQATWPAVLEMVRRLHEAGITITAGTDFGNPWLVPGAAYHRELELLVSAGIEPLDVLTMATRNPTAALGVGDSLGILLPDRRADFVILSRDPLLDITNTRSIEAVYQNGRRVDREAPQTPQD
jgi:imidazolonepropionase-like amidohydrolase